MSNTLLVTGASGQLGRRVVAHLIQTHHIAPQRIIATTRKPEALADLAAQGVVVRRADFEDPASLAVAFAGSTCTTCTSAIPGNAFRSARCTSASR